jgi:hypothetical protein
MAPATQFNNAVDCLLDAQFPSLLETPTFQRSQTVDQKGVKMNNLYQILAQELGEIDMLETAAWQRVGTSVDSSLKMQFPPGLEPSTFQQCQPVDQNDVQMEPALIKLDALPQHELCSAQAWVSISDEPKKIFINGLSDDTYKPVEAELFDAELFDETDSFAANSLPSQLAHDIGERKQSCRWHETLKSIGIVSCDGHVFTKVAGADQIKINTAGIPTKLSTICMIFDDRLRCGGLHEYCYTILEGEVGAADGVGFIFDNKLKRNNIQKTRAIFLNRRGQVCFRDRSHVQKFDVQLPSISVGMSINFVVDLNNAYAYFELSDHDGIICGSAKVAFGAYLGNPVSVTRTSSPRTGFFCAIVTKDISVHLE